MHLQTFMTIEQQESLCSLETEVVCAEHLIRITSAISNYVVFFKIYNVCEMHAKP